MSKTPRMPRCAQCGHGPAKLLIEANDERMCGVCWHRVLVARDILARAARGRS